MGVKYDPGGGGGAGVTSFSDPLTAATTFWMGPNWDLSLTFRETSLVGTTLDTFVNNGAQGVTFGSAAGSGALGTFQAFPNTVDNSTIIAQSGTRGSFAQARFTAKSGGLSGFAGITTMMQMSEIGYALMAGILDGGTAVLFRYNGNYAVGSILNAAPFTYVANDVWRLETKVVGATVQLKTFKNGVLQSTDSDAAGSRITSGRYGFTCPGIGPNSFLSFDNFAGGLL
jgi:hypothetical protein